MYRIRFSLLSRMISLRFIGHLRDDELKVLSRSRNVSQPLKSAALQRIVAKEKKDKGN